MKVSSPFNHLVPKEYAANLKWRASIFRKVLKDTEYAGVIKDACSRDPLFFINGFVYTHDTRREPFSKLPFILYEFQEEGIMEILSAVNDHDLMIEKSRDMGVSWMNIAAIFWCWLFLDGRHFLFGSRNEEYIDKKGNPKALFTRFDFILDNLPEWMKPVGFNPNQNRTTNHIDNPEKYNVVDGESTTAEFASGDRRYAVFLDEFSKVKLGGPILSATRDVTRSRIFNGTPYGINNAFFDLRSTNIKKLCFHWSLHPIKAIGLYTKHDDTYEFIDKKYWDEVEDKVECAQMFDQMILGMRVPLPSGKFRSPWYAEQCERALSAREIAQELDIDYEGSGSQYFHAEDVIESRRKYSMPPLVVGDLEFDPTTGDIIRFTENPKGTLKLWCLLSDSGKPLIGDDIVLGIDVSAGTGASNSCICGWNKVTHAKALEFVNPFIRPEALAAQALAIAKWTDNPAMIWESGGPGRQFGSRLKELGYYNFYLRKNDDSISGRVSDIPGVAQTRETKLVIMGRYRDAVESMRAVNKSKLALEECLEYIHDPSGGVVHSRAANKTDPSGAKANHGDRVMADALAWKLMEERGGAAKKPEREIPVGSLAWRNKMRTDKKKTTNRELSKDWV